MKGDFCYYIHFYRELPRLDRANTILGITYIYTTSSFDIQTNTVPMRPPQTRFQIHTAVFSPHYINDTTNIKPVSYHITHILNYKFTHILT